MFSCFFFCEKKQKEKYYILRLYVSNVNLHYLTFSTKVWIFLFFYMITSSFTSMLISYKNFLLSCWWLLDIICGSYINSSNTLCFPCKLHNLVSFKGTIFFFQLLLYFSSAPLSRFKMQIHYATGPHIIREKVLTTFLCQKL